MSMSYNDWMAEAREWADGGYHGRARSCRLSAARLLGRHTRVEWEALKASMHGICPRCRKATHHFVKDHIVPIYAGGSDGVDNIQPLCAPCNAAKGSERTNWLKAECEA